MPAAPDPDLVMDLIEAFRRSKTMFAAVSLGIFETLEPGALSAPALATRLSLEPSALSRLLEACVAIRLLERVGETYRNTPTASAYLRPQSDSQLTGYIKYSNDVLWKLWAVLEDAVREGTHRWQQVYGWDEPIFSSFFRSEEALREFLLGMHGQGLLSSPRVVEAFDLAPFRRLVDLGGATGHLAVAACKRYPQLKAAVFDLPRALPLAREYVDASGMNDRVEVIGGDFFADPLPDADLYSLGRILHDWSEDKAVLLLDKILDKLPSGGALLVAEKLLTADRSGPTWASMQDLGMLLYTEGRERTFEEYRKLLEQAGFRNIEQRTVAAPLDALLARKP